MSSSPSPESDPAAAVSDLYERRAEHWISARGREAGLERPWLDALCEGLPPGGSILDVGCGHGYPIAAYLISRGFKLTGVDSSPTLVAAARHAFPCLHMARERYADA